jgi:hypothetical protein
VTYIRPEFMTNASPEAIEHAIREAELTRDRYAKKASVLRGLLDVRHDQIAAGTWPPKTNTA